MNNTKLPMYNSLNILHNYFPASLVTYVMKTFLFHHRISRADTSVAKPVIRFKKFQTSLKLKLTF